MCQVRKKPPALVKNNFQIVRDFTENELSPSQCVNKQITAMNFMKKKNIINMVMHFYFIMQLQNCYATKYFHFHIFITEDTFDNILTDCAYLTFMILLCADKMKQFTLLITVHGG